MPNVRGSTGYGQKFVEMNKADWGGGDFKDVMAGVDHLIQTGVADPDKLGLGCWSYGGYMAAWAITQTDRFKAVVVGAGMSDLASEFGTEDDSSYDEWFFGLPWENLKEFQESSPITYAGRAKTPALILHGENDATDPIGQAQQFYRALKRLGVASDLVVYPRAGHGLREEKHILDSWRRITGWFDRYVRGMVEPPKPAAPTSQPTDSGG
jgi:dipeptidyl aminopeptidase/acylaminoacyl peptidase